MEQLYPVRNILCIDLKSFFAAAECADRGLDMFTTPLVVADPARGNGGITLAVTPFLKALGIKSRGRIYEIPRNIKYLRVKPRMSLYIKKSKEVIDVYLDFVAKDDLYVYSIDEVFLDVTDYLKLYKMDDYHLAEKILKTIYKKTGLTANCGIGPNMLLAKLAMDIDGKSAKNAIAKWEYKDIPSKLWTISPLSEMWGIGHGMEKRLNNLGLYTIGDIAKYSKNELIKKFGIMGGELWNHANGIDLTNIKDCSIHVSEKSISHSQILFKDYYNDNIKIIIKEMVEVLTKRLRTLGSISGLLFFGIGYSKVIGGGFSKSMKLSHHTDDSTELTNLCFGIFDNYYEENKPIRSVHLSLGKLEIKTSMQLSLFEDSESIKARDSINYTIDEIHLKYGKNSILNASTLTSDSTMIKRNNKIGGHES